MDTKEWLELGLRIAGVGQMGLVLVTPLVVLLLDWRGKTDDVDPVVRTIFWIYCGYILTLNFAFGVASVAMPAELLAGTPLAAAVVGLILAYWGVRLVLQFTAVHGAYTHTHWISRAGETALTGLFVYLTAAYGAALAFNLGAF